MSSFVSAAISHRTICLYELFQVPICENILWHVNNNHNFAYIYRDNKLIGLPNLCIHRFPNPQVITGKGKNAWPFSEGGL